MGLRVNAAHRGEPVFEKSARDHRPACGQIAQAAP
jgi:hypothetical protein